LALGQGHVLKGTAALIVLFLVQALCALFFVSDIAMSVFGIYPVPLSWTSREVLEIGAAIGLVLGLIFGALALRRSLTQLKIARARLRRASSAFMDILIEHFDDWGLTPAERDVALFSIKGMSTQEIAALRKTSEGTVKAQTNAIYRKAGVSGRPQLLSLFIEDLMQEPIHLRVVQDPVEVRAAE
jgi:DNA-binding CsgD family transcriptional regulator